MRSTPKEVEVHRKVYKQVLRLQKHGLLVQVKQAGKPIKYNKTPRFYETTFVEVFNREVKKETAFSQEEKTVFATVQLPIVEQLQRQASQYQFDLWSCISESEEYLRLGNEFPGIRFQFEAGYHESTERRSKLQGQLRAIETVLMQYTDKAISYS